jgi:hypothetical protein
MIPDNTAHVQRLATIHWLAGGCTPRPNDVSINIISLYVVQYKTRLSWNSSRIQTPDTTSNSSACKVWNLLCEN